MNHKAFLQALQPDTLVLFVSDPVKGDTFAQKPGLVEIPNTAEGHEVNTAQHFLDTLDFETYEN